MKKNSVFLIISMLCLAGCLIDSEDEVHEYIDSVKQRPGKPIGSLPIITEYEAVAYYNSVERSPFEVELEAKATNKNLESSTTNGIQPDFDREQESLESFPLDSLKMVGTLAKEDQVWGLISDTTGLIHRVKVGNYLGQNYGHIEAISEKEIVVNEIVRDNRGGWRKRKAAIMIKQ